MEFSNCSEVLDILKKTYCKLLVVNFKKNSYQPKIIPDDEVRALGNMMDFNLSNYVAWFCSSDFIHPNDREKLRDFFAIAKVGDETAYRRKINGVYRKVALLLQPAFDDLDEVILYVRDIENLYYKEREEVLETDEQTGLLNRHAFFRDCRRYEGGKVGILYADLNGLKFTNDTKGHAAGDDLIKRLANLLRLNFQTCSVYHISGDEFIVAAFGCRLQDFLINAMAFHKSLWTAQDVPIASIGYSIGEAGMDSIEETVTAAEKSMYNDKMMFYQKFPQFARK